MYLKHSMIVLVLSATLIMVNCQVQASQIAFGSLTDPSGDSGAGAADFTSLFITVDSIGTALVSVRFAPGTFAADSSSWISFDVDQNPATGWAGTDSAHTDSDLIGVEYGVEIYGSGFQSNAILWLYSGGVWNSGNTYSVTYLSNGCDAVVPLADIGNDDGFLNFCGAVQTQLTSNTFTGINDYIPNKGQPVGSTIPEPASLVLLGLGGLAAMRRRRA